MKKILSKVFKAPVVFSFGVIAAFALFVFLQPQKPAVGVAEANSSKGAGEIKTEAPQAEVGIVSEQESVFLDSISPEVASVAEVSGSGYVDSSTDWSIRFLPFTMSETPDYPSQRFMLDLNGDGLTDYIRSERNVYDRNNNGSIYRSGEVYLNNGKGWTLVYKIGIDPAESEMREGCFTDYSTSWPKSSQHKESDWEWNMPVKMIKSPYEYNWFESFADLNGDGLPDYVWSERKDDDDHHKGNYRECVYLNNGHGWDSAYRCVHNYYSNSGHHYYGDCAQQ